MLLLRRSAKRLLRNKVNGSIPLRHTFFHRHPLDREPAQEHIIKQFARSFSVFADNHPLKDEQEGRPLIDGYLDVSISQRICTVLSEEKCRGEGLELGDLELAGEASVSKIVTHVDDCQCMYADDSVSKCVSTLEIGYEKKTGNSRIEGTSDCLIAGTGRIISKNKEIRKQFGSNTLELAEESFFRTQKKGNDGSTSEPAIVSPFETSCRVISNERHFGSSAASETSQIAEFLSRGKQGHIVDDSTSPIIVRDIRALAEDYTVELMKKKEKVKSSVHKIGPRTEDVAMARVKDTSGVQISICNSTKEQTHSGRSAALEKAESFRNKQELVSRRCEREYSDVQKKLKKIKKKKIEKKKRLHTDIRVRPEDLEHVSLSPHPLPADPGGQTLCKEKLKNRGDCVNDDHVPGYLEPVARDAPKLIKRAKGKRKKHRRLLEKIPSTSQEAYRLLPLAARDQAQFNDLSRAGGSDSTFSPNFDCKSQSVYPEMKTQMCKEYDGEKKACTGMISHSHFKDGTSLDPPRDFWENDWTSTPIEPVECERHESDLGGLRKVHQSLKSYGELYVILDLNGVLIKRWDKNPSLPGVKKVNRKWIQLRPGCIEFLQKVFTAFRVGIWSTMMPANVLSTCKFIEEEARQKLPFFMLWSKESCYQKRGLQRPDKANVAADFKPLSRVWGYFQPYLGFHNTVLIDDSPYKACMNNPHSCIFPNPFEGSTDDVYLNNVLWPYLEKMRMSRNIQAFVAKNPHGQPPVVAGHDLYRHVCQVIQVDEHDYNASTLTRVT